MCVLHTCGQEACSSCIPVSHGHLSVLHTSMSFTPVYPACLGVLHPLTSCMHESCMTVSWKLVCPACQGVFYVWVSSCHFFLHTWLSFMAMHPACLFSLYTCVMHAFMSYMPMCFACLCPACLFDLHAFASCIPVCPACISVLHVCVPYQTAFFPPVSCMPLACLKQQAAKKTLQGRRQWDETMHTGRHTLQGGHSLPVFS
jgi:hypothetical protein